MRVCFEIFMRLSVRFVWRKEGKNEAFSMRASRSSFFARDPKKNANAHFVSFFDERKNLNRKNRKNRSIKKREKRDTAEKRIEFFLSNAQLSSFLRPFFSS